MLVCSVYIMLLKQTKPWEVLTKVDSVVIVSTLTLCVLLHSRLDLKAPQMNVQHCLVQELVLYEFELGHNTKEANKTFVMQKEKEQLIKVQWTNQMVREILLWLQEQLVCIQSFSLPKLVAIPMLKNPVCSTTYP